MDNTLQKTFLTFTANQNSMDNRTFVKLMKDCKLLNNALTTTDLDINFAKVKDKAEKKITFDQFKQALELCAPKLKMTPEQIFAKVQSSSGPEFKGTKADNVKLHDDKSTYTGVYAKGGPSVSDNDKVKDLSNLCNRGEADVRGTNKR